MKKKFIAVLMTLCLTVPMLACGGKTDKPADTPSGEKEAVTDAHAEEAKETDSELVDGRFKETRHIRVEVYDRNVDNGSDPLNNMYTEYIKNGVLEKHNIEVEFVAVPRWTEVDEINNLLAAGSAPDICVTYDYPTVQTYANMDGILDMQSYLDEYKEQLPNLFNWLGETNLYWNKSPKDGTIWAIEGKRATTNRINTFVREDWLKALDLKVPQTTQEFEDMLVAFRDNADTLLGSDASKMIPYSVSYDVGWRAATLIESKMDPEVSDYDYYVNGFDDRKLTQDGTKDAIKLLNKWYNEKLMWDDFALFGEGDTTEDDMLKAGYVGAFTHNWDYPFRNGEDSINANLQRIVGENAGFIAIDPFEDRTGKHTKFVTSTAGDRKIFFPSTNKEPLACMLYLDWISDPEHIQYLQIGDEGVTHNVLEDGAYEIVATTGDAIMNSAMNIDYTITCNGLHLKDEDITLKSISHSYAGIAPEIVMEANRIANTDCRREKNVNVGQVKSEDGMGTALSEKRNILYDKAVAASPSEFDSVWDEYMEDYMASGGKAIAEERAQLWAEVYGDKKMLN